MHFRVEQPLLASSLNLFVNVKSALKRCMSISSGKALFDLHLSFVRAFQYYANSVKQLIPKYEPEKRSGCRFTTSDKTKLSEKDEQMLATIINSCEYCLETIRDLQNTLVEKVEESQKSAVDMYKALSYFEDVNSECFSLEISWIGNKMESHYQNMYKINWASLDKTDDTSGYAKGLSEAFLSSAAIMKATLSDNFYLVFINRIVSVVSDSFMSHVYKNKRTNEIASQQVRPSHAKRG